MARDSPPRELGTVPMIHFPKEMVSRSEKFGTVPVFQISRSATTTPLIRFICAICGSLKDFCELFCALRNILYFCHRYA